MAREVEFLFDFGSPTAYLAYTQLPRIAAQRKARILWRPILLGGVHKASGNSPPMTVPAKGRWMFHDIARWVKRYGVAYQMNPHFPINTVALMRAAVGVQMKMPEQFIPFVDAVYKAFWADARNMGDAAEVGSVLRAAGLDAERIVALTAEQEVKDRLKSNSDEAVARGVFGAPSFFVGGELFFGQDRLEFVAEALDALPA